MSLKLSRNKVNRLATLIAQHIEKSEELDYMEDVGHIRYRVFHLIMDELRIFEHIEEDARQKMQIQKRNVPEGSREWEILVRKYVGEELCKLGKFWN